MRRAIVLLSVLLLWLTPAAAQTRLGLFYTAEEVAVWRTRTVSGPYRVAGDVQTNSPGDWARILSNATTFLSNPSIGRWAGKTGSCFSNSDRGINGISFDDGRHLRDAAFAWLMIQDTTYRDAVRDELLTQAGLAGTAWDSTTVWSGDCLAVLTDPTAVLEVHTWLYKLLVAYDYIRNDISAGQRTTLDAWFTVAATRFVYLLNVHIAEKRWPLRSSDTYDTSPLAPGTSVTLYHGGPLRYSWHGGWNNITVFEAIFGGLVGVLTNDATLIGHGKRYLTEMVRYGMWSDGGLLEQSRWHDSNGYPCRGFFYTWDMLIGPVLFADALARSGDTSMLAYTSSVGYLGTEGGTKSLQGAVTHAVNLVNGTVSKYGTTQAGQVGDPVYRIDSDCAAHPNTAWRGVEDITSALLDNFYAGTYTTAYLRQRVGDPAYPANGGTSSGGCGTSWEGPWCVLPGVLLLYGQLDGVVDPYTGAPGAEHPTLIAGASYVQRSQPTLVRLVLDDKGNGPILPASSATGFTCAVDSSPVIVSSAACGTLFTSVEGVKVGCTLTLATPIASAAEVLTCSYSQGAGSVTDSQGSPQELAAFTDAPVKNYYDQVLNIDNATTISAVGDTGRPFVALFDGNYSTEASSWVVSGAAPNTATALFDFGAALTLNNLIIGGDNTGTKQCETVTLEFDATCTASYTTQVTTQNCNAKQQFIYAVSNVSAQCWRLTIADNRAGASTGVQAFEANVTVTPDDPPDPSPDLLGQLAVGGFRLVGVTLGGP